MDALQQALIDTLGADKVVRGDDLDRYDADGLRPSRAYPNLARIVAAPLLAVRPTATAEVAAIVRLAAEHRTPLVPYGGGSGLMGGAVPVAPSIVVDLTAMNRILDISRDDRTASVEAGAILADLERELNQHDLILGHDPWSLPIATVGGAIGTDGLGYRALRYGSMGDQVLGLVAVLPDGQVLRTRAVPRHATGIDLNRLFIGGEGCFGIVTEATLRVFPRPERTEVRAYAFDGFEAGFAAIMDMFASDLRPAMVDFGEGYAAPVRSGGRRALSAFRQECNLYIGLEGFAEQVEAQAQRVAAVCAQRGGRDLGPGEAWQFWNSRHEAAERYVRNQVVRVGERLISAVTGARLDYIHVALPASKVLDYRRGCQAIMERHRVRPLEYGVWCQPELFSVVMVKASLASFRRKNADDDLAQAFDEMLALAHTFGGSMEYCHGVGIRLAHLMEQEHGLGLAVMRAIKAALDPNAIMNPSKVGL